MKPMPSIHQSEQNIFSKTLNPLRLMLVILMMGASVVIDTRIAKAQSESSTAEQKNEEGTSPKTRDIVYLADSRKLVGKVIARSENGKISFQNFEDNVVYELERGSYKWLQTETVYPTQITSQLTFNYGLIDAYRAGAGLRVGVILPNSPIEITAGYGLFSGRAANGFTVQDARTVPLREEITLQSADITINYHFRLTSDLTLRPFTGFGVNFVAYNRIITLPDFINPPTVDVPISEDYLELRLNVGAALDYRISGPVFLTASAAYFHELGSDYGLAAFPQILTYKNAVVTSAGIRFIF